MDQVTPLSPRRFAGLDAGLMVTRVTAGYFAEHPELGERERIRMRPDCERDLNAHYRFLQAAMIYGAPQVFEQYTCWLGDVYRHHRLPKDYLVDTFRLLGAYLERHLPEATAALAVGLLASARETLRGAVVEVPDPSRRGLLLAGAGDFTQALVGGDSGVAGSVAERALAGGLGLVDVAVGVIQPSMYEIGR
ncbi:MAG: hypothetical protein G8D58_04220 [gamma proteobacterium symbiont of Phacoides pectinatus]